MSSESPTPARGKKSVALSGVVAANTALCTVGRTGNDLHYRGYDILEVAEACEFEEIAHLLVHERLPSLGAGELSGLTFAVDPSRLGAAARCGIFDWPVETPTSQQRAARA